MSEWQLVRYTAACPRCGVDVEWQAMPVPVSNPAWRTPNRHGMEIKYSWRGCSCLDQRGVA